ncbi:hypothetical protein DBB36_20035 [Flavobacterium sp. WLB]|uniref:hypothetical protein n=1 Tax=unclassified Flavobacterium TaxID=196869 RepID=UPI0006ABCA92|nr:MULTISPECIES: hypothetical protein [unclassified Flavobacterium]OWU92328.1 hypothetical protein APR43_03565 [Flavobacterium sp. NLM]PUU68220.1 hypothetical protein DBB36_20035 [Flavobacterium sp. WLB]
MEYIFEKYDLNLLDCDNDSCKIQLSPQNGNALSKERRKLYIIHHENEILYVGEANTSIKTRFQRGCTSFNYYIKNGEARKGYKGYKWLNKIDNTYRNLSVSVAIFDHKYDNERNFIEAIEGELVYLVRKNYGYWPKFQNEIHFSNCEGAKEIGEEIFSIILNLK